MKIECVKKDLEEAVDTVSRVVSHSASLPVLQCVVFQADDNGIVARATNLELGIEENVTGEVKKNGSIAIPAQTLLATLKTSPRATKVVLETDEGSVHVVAGGSNTTIKTIPLDDFPTIPKPESATTFSLPRGSLITGVRSVLYSASTSLIKPELASVYMYQDGQELVFVATDSFRLAEKRIEHKTDQDIPEVIMPAKNVTELIRTLENQRTETISVAIDENQYAVTADHLFVTSRIIDGSYPDYTSIIPRDTATEAVLLKEDLANTLKKAQIFSDKFGQLTIHAYPEKHTFTISARNSDVGEVFDSLDATLTGDEIDISFNHRYLADCLQSISADSITLTFAGSGKPLVVRGVGDRSFMYLVMPMNR